MKLSIRAKIGAGFALALLFLVIIGAISYRSIASFVEINERLAHGYEVLATLDSLDSAMEDAEVGSHGYAITGEEQYLALDEGAAARINQTMADLRRLTADCPGQQRRVDALAPLIAGELELLKAEVSSRKGQGLESAMKLILTDRQKEIRDDFHRLENEIENGERGAIEQRHEQVRWRARDTIVLIVLGSALAFALMGLAIFVVDRDMVRRLRAERALGESEARFRRLAENARDLIFRYEVGARRGFGYVSPAATRLLGCTPDRMCADPDPGLTMVHPDDRRLFHLPLEEQVAAQPLIVRWVHKDGRTVWTELRNSPILDDAGNLVAIEGIARDITERKQIEEQLLRAQRLETAGRVADQVAHDFNNLLSPLVAYPDLIKMRLPEGDPALQFCDAMQKAAQRLAQINEDLLTLGRRGRAAEETVQINRVVQEAVATMPPLPRTVALELDLAGQLQ